MATKWTYDDLAQAVCREGVKVVNINGRDLQGTFDHITKTLTWQCDYAVRDEAYVQKLIDGTLDGEAVFE